MNLRQADNTPAMCASTVIRDVLYVVVGCVIYALSINIFTSPNDIAPGGVVGVATMLSHLMPALPIGAMTFIINIPIFILGGVELGRRYIVKSVATTALASIFIDLIAAEPICSIVRPYTGDTLLASIFGGVLCGIGLSLVLYRGSSTGGTDIISGVLHKRLPHLSVGRFMLAVDLAVVVAAAFVYGNIESSLYAFISIFVYSRVIDAVLCGIARDNGKLMFIITCEYERLTQEIIHSADRGVTLLDAEGGYLGDSKKVLMCALRPRQLGRLSNVVRRIDPEAFVIILAAGTISGRGFKSGSE